MGRVAEHSERRGILLDADERDLRARLEIRKAREEQRQLLFARLAPRRPEVDERRMTLERGEVEVLSIFAGNREGERPTGRCSERLALGDAAEPQARLPPVLLEVLV